MKKRVNFPIWSFKTYMLIHVYIQKKKKKKVDKDVITETVMESHGEKVQIHMVTVHIYSGENITRQPI